MDHCGLIRCQLQVARELLRHSLQADAGEKRRLRMVEPPLDMPVAVPDAAQLRAREPGSGAVETLRVHELLAAEIAHGEMREPDIVHVPDVPGLATIDAVAKKRKLITEQMTCRASQVSG